MKPYLIAFVVVHLGVAGLYYGVQRWMADPDRQKAAVASLNVVASDDGR